jgi:hypothetical protein
MRYPVLLNFQLVFVALVFPVSLSVAGLLISWFYELIHLKLLLVISGFCLGLAVNAICYYRKLFTILLYKAPAPLILFIMPWWMTYDFFSTLTSFLIGLAGLLTGLFINAVLVHPYQFYRIPKRILAVIYLLFSIILIGIFMGVPVFNLLLGALAGNYLSIRTLTYKREQKHINRHVMWGALFTALIMLIMVALSGFMTGLNSESMLNTVNELLNTNVDAQTWQYLLVSIGILLIVGQYLLTYFTAHTLIAYRQKMRML